MTTSQIGISLGELVEKWNQVLNSTENMIDLLRQVLENESKINKKRRKQSQASLVSKPAPVTPSSEKAITPKPMTKVQAQRQAEVSQQNTNTSLLQQKVENEKREVKETPQIQNRTESPRKSVAITVQTAPEWTDFPHEKKEQTKSSQIAKSVDSKSTQPQSIPKVPAKTVVASTPAQNVSKPTAPSNGQPGGPIVQQKTQIEKHQMKETTVSTQNEPRKSMQITMKNGTVLQQQTEMEKQQRKETTMNMQNQKASPRKSMQITVKKSPRTRSFHPTKDRGSDE